MATPAGPQKRRRVTQACDYCHRRSIRCRPADGDAHSRCTNCIDFSQPCTRNRIVQRRGAKPKQQTARQATPDATREVSSTATTPRSFEASAVSAWSGPHVASQAVVVDLIEIYFEVVYPIFPLFHRPTFLRQISRGEYTSNRQLFAVTMAACALSSARVTDNAVTNMVWDHQNLLSTSSDVFYEAAIGALPTTETPKQSLDLMRAYALLSLAAIQNGKTRDMQAYLGRYHALVAMDGLHDEENWPRDLTVVELEERRRLYWSMYTLDIFFSVVFDSMARSREQQSNVRYPTELDDAFFDNTGYRGDYQSPINCSSPSNHVSPDSWLHGYNIITDLWRLIEHVTVKLQRHTKRKRSYLEITADFETFPSAATIQVEIDRIYYNLPRHFLVTEEMSGDRTKDLYGFQAANITATVQLLRMVLLASEENTVEQRCRVVSEVVNAFMQIPISYLRAISSPLLHHLRGIGSILGGVLEESLNSYQYQQVRTVLLSLAQLLENLDFGNHSVQSAQKLRDLVTRIDHHMALRVDKDSTASDALPFSPISGLQLPHDFLFE
ncbi:fungal-specific transcription factor domain-containing protein [Pyrenochaeta sp. MPI-SDFR-AT-0127]|nr:fungal-specific transcription factor domain-containing protein [Pyrenochaeta sp. MPI-SDFR-AT-0127]